MRTGRFKYSFIVFIVGLLPLLLVYQNCGRKRPISGSNYDDTVVKLNNQNVSLNESTLQERLQICSEASHYVCTEKTFSPSLLAHDEEFEQCVEVGTPNAPKNICFTVSASYHDTSNDLKNCESCTKYDREPGGRYNYKEVQCRNNQIMNGTQYPVQLSGVDVEEVGAALYQSCLETLAAF